MTGIRPFLILALVAMLVPIAPIVSDAVLLAQQQPGLSADQLADLNALNLQNYYAPSLDALPNMVSNTMNLRVADRFRGRRRPCGDEPHGVEAAGAVTPLLLRTATS